MNRGLTGIFSRVTDQYSLTNPTFALIIVDLQNDFINGSLAVKDGEKVLPIVNDLAKSNSFNTIVHTQDWHPPNHSSFFSNLHAYPLAPDSPISEKDAKMFDEVIQKGPPKTVQVLWPTHCVQGSKGAEFHQDLVIRPTDDIVQKGTHATVDSYSGFWDNGRGAETRLAQLLKSRNTTHVFVVGLAFDYCVGFTALHAKEHGFKTYLVADASRSVAKESEKKMIENLKNAGVELIEARQVANVIRDVKANTVSAYSLLSFLVILIALVLLLLHQTNFI
eukprot:TRINITY_DN12185_c0_g1_i1.p1 TRINITY_DN12185_c0_g1~~TRINITY_DN12185_c0_g1_i1.p1  ORF type:complete len:278 (-),score=50.80 TRINITY_DN12185_c0_g1_i1:99-932(-)